MWGAGPGDPELLTIKARKAIEQAGLVLFAGSLVPPDVVACAKAGARVEDSAPLTLEECHALVRDAALAGESVARVHTGDPLAVWRAARAGCAAGSGRHPLAGDSRKSQGWACAAAAAAGVTFTVPEVTQSLIISRMEGRTPVPERERLAALAAHNTSMAVYLSAHSAAALQEELSRSLPPETPVLCAYRVGWPEEKLIRTSLGELARSVTAHGITRQAVFLVLPGELEKGAASHLYADNFKHGFRN